IRLEMYQCDPVCASGLIRRRFGRDRTRPYGAGQKSGRDRWARPAPKRSLMVLRHAGENSVNDRRGGDAADRILTVRSWYLEESKKEKTGRGCWHRTDNLYSRRGIWGRLEEALYLTACRCGRAARWHWGIRPLAWRSWSAHARGSE